MSRAALKVVETSFYTEEVEFGSAEQRRDAHSLHYAIPYPDTSRPEIAAYFIQRYTRRGGVVLDPFCGSGATGLEANLLGRSAILTDISPLAVLLAQAKLAPADITEVTLRLQQCNLRRPINAKVFDEYFSPFYDLDTFREIVNLKQFLLGNGDRVSRFIQMIAASLLHGHSAGYFSVYSLPQVALRPADQIKLNDKRKQVPDYRAVVPRILRKTASALRDGVPSILRQQQARNQLSVSDARDLSSVKSSEVDLVVTSPPLPHSNIAAGQWLRLWFYGIGETPSPQSAGAGNGLQDWSDFMNEALVELARVVHGNGRVVLDLCECSVDGESVRLDEQVIALVHESLSRFWEPEALLLQRARATAVRQTLTEGHGHGSASRNRVLVLKRK